MPIGWDGLDVGRTIDHTVSISWPHFLLNSPTALFLLCVHLFQILATQSALFIPFRLSKANYGVILVLRTRSRDSDLVRSEGNRGSEEALKGRKKLVLLLKSCQCCSTTPSDAWYTSIEVNLVLRVRCVPVHIVRTTRGQPQIRTVDFSLGFFFYDFTSTPKVFIITNWSSFTHILLFHYPTRALLSSHRLRVAGYTMAIMVDPFEPAAAASNVIGDARRLTSQVANSAIFPTQLSQNGDSKTTARPMKQVEKEDAINVSTSFRPHFQSHCTREQYR